MGAYRVAAELPQEDLHSLVAEATEQVRRQRLERRLAWCAGVLSLGSRTRPSGAPAPQSEPEGADAAFAVLGPIALILGLLALPLMAFGVYVALLVWACTSIVRTWTESRLYGKRKHPRPLASACVLFLLLPFGAYAFAAIVGDATSSTAASLLGFGLVCAVIAYRRREWSSDVAASVDEDPYPRHQ